MPEPSLLESVGFTWMHGSLELDGDVFYRRGAQVLDLVPIVDTLRPPRTLGRLEHIAWPTEFLQPLEVRAQGQTLRTLTAENHLHMKALVRDFYGFPEMRDKDRTDVVALEAVLATHL